MDTVAVGTPIPVGGNAAVPGIVNDAIPTPTQPNGVASFVISIEPENTVQPVVTTSQSFATNTVENGTDTQWTSVQTMVDGGPTASSQTGLATSAVPTTQASIEPVAASSSSNGSNLSSGAVAGIAIATLLLGAALAFAAAFLLFKRRNKNPTSQTSRSGPVDYNTYTDSTPELVMLQKGHNSPYVQVRQSPLPVPVPRPQSPSALDFLPAPAHDADIATRIQNMFAQIHRHIETYYRDVHASITPSMAPALCDFGAKDVNMADLLSDCTNATTVLRHALTGYVVGITSPGDTLFPGELNGVQGGSTADPNVQEAVTLQRRLASYIYINTQRTERSAVREAAEHFSLAFFPWAKPGADDTEKDDDLAHVMEQALETRVWLFGQPGEYVFRWDGVGTRGIVVCPEVVRVDGGNGREGIVLESRVVGV